MKTRPFVAIASVVFLATSYSCHAFVGETYGEVTARYGQPTDSVIGEQQYTYEASGMKIVVTFVKQGQPVRSVFSAE